jgi:hypothetical protein
MFAAPLEGVTKEMFKEETGGRVCRHGHDNFSRYLVVTAATSGGCYEKKPEKPFFEVTMWVSSALTAH